MDAEEEEIRRWRTASEGDEDPDEEEEAGVVQDFAAALAPWKDDVEMWTWMRAILRPALVAAIKKLGTRRRTFFLLEASNVHPSKHTPRCEETRHSKVSGQLASSKS